MTDTTLITCPSCGTEIPLTEALTGKIKQQMRSEMEALIKEKEAKIIEREKQLEASQKNMEEEIKKQVEAEKKDMWERAENFKKCIS